MDLDEAGAEPGPSAQARVSGGRGRAAAALSGGDTWEDAVEALLASLAGEAPADLAVVFIDSLFGHTREICERLRRGLGARHLIGCTGQSVIGPGVEAEDSAAISALTLRLPGARFIPIPVIPGETTEASLAALSEAETDSWLLFADPFSLQTEHLVQALQARRPDIVLLGGMASAHNNEAGTSVFLDDNVSEEGAVLMGLEGVKLRPVVAQGAVPLGRPLTITDCERNLVQTVGSRPALEVLRGVLSELDEETRSRVGRNLLVGLAMDEYREVHDRGDYLIRNITGVDQDSGSIAINAIPRVGQTFQFQFRDAAAAHEDLTRKLEETRAALADDELVLGSVLCVCNGRGQGLFGEPNHDAAALESALGDVPTAGFFCNGEIGPVGSENFLHGFTASIGLLTTSAR